MSLGLRRCVEGNKVEAERSYHEITLLLLLARVVVKILGYYVNSSRNILLEYDFLCFILCSQRDPVPLVGNRLVLSVYFLICS